MRFAVLLLLLLLPFPASAGAQSERCPPLGVVSGEAAEKALPQFVRAGECSYRTGQYAEALDAFKIALNIAHTLGRTRDEAAISLDIGNTNVHLAHYADAFQAYQKSLEGFSKLKDREGEANALVAYRAALPFYSQLDDAGGEAASYTFIASADLDLQNYDDALRSLERARMLFHQVNDASGEALAWLFTGDAYQHLYRYDEMIHAYSEGLDLDQAAAETNDGFTRELNDLTNSSAAALDAGQYQAALTWMQRQLALCQQRGNAYCVASARSRLGVVESYLGMYDDSLTLLTQAEDTWLGSQGNSGDALAALLNIASVQGHLGQWTKALQSYQDALTELHAYGSSAYWALAGIGNAQSNLGNDRAALQSYQTALALMKVDGMAPSVQAVALGNIAVEDVALGQYAPALAAARLAAGFGAHDEGMQWDNSRILALAESKLNHIDSALAHYKAAVQDIEQLRAGLDTGERAAFFSDKLFVYDEYIAYLLELNRRFPNKGYGEKALEIFERKAGRATLEQIGASAAQHFKGVLPTVIEREMALEAALSAARTTYESLLAAAKPDPKALAQAKAALTQAQAEQAADQAHIKAASPEYYALRHPQPIDLRTLQARLARGQVILVYDLLKDGSVAWVVTRDRFLLVNLPGSETINTAVAAVRARIGAIQASRIRPHTPSSIAAFDDDSHRLYQALIPGPIAQMLVGASSLVVVPSGSLFEMPFEALVTGDAEDAAHPHYLIADLPISYASSASLFAAVDHAYVNHVPAPQPFFAMADPAFPQPASGGPEAAAGTFNRLTYTLTEADDVRMKLDAPVGSVFSGEAATLARLMDMNDHKTLAAYRYILFATHAVLPDQIKGLSQPAIVLAHPELGDGFLKMSDVFGLSLDADVVMLSACDTGVVSDPSGDGISGLTRAFLYAGTPAVTVTLWQVDDPAGPQLTPLFFAAMKAGETPARAMQSAQLVMIRSGDLTESHPFEWAPFVIFGDGDFAGKR
jgi:CHAT domain-containing protein